MTPTVVYSTESGDMTASTLIRMFQDRAASTSTVISVGSQTATIVSVCSPYCTPELQPSPTSTSELQVEGSSPTTSILEPPVERPHPTVAACRYASGRTTFYHYTRVANGKTKSNHCTRAVNGTTKSNHCTQATRSEETTNIKCIVVGVYLGGLATGIIILIITAVIKW